MLDSIDIKILSNLQSYGRMSNVTLAKKVGISAPPCLRRFKIMEGKGILSGYHAVVNPELLGFTIRALCVVSLVSQSSTVVEDFLKLVNSESNIRSCFATSGNESFILNIVSKDLKEYEKILKDILHDSGIVSNISSYIMLNKYKDEFGIPIE